jgi:hypothetical protein
MLESFTADTFRPHLDENFRMDRNGVVLRLRSVDDWSERAGPGAAGRERAPFSLVFHAAEGPVYPQGIYPLEHDVLGNFALFMVPIGRDAEGVKYEAVFT